MMGGLGGEQVKYALPIRDLSRPMNRLPATARSAFLPIEDRQWDDCYVGELAIRITKSLACLDIGFYGKSHP
jgi:hypothetical protein